MTEKKLVSQFQKKKLVKKHSFKKTIRFMTEKKKKFGRLKKFGLWPKKKTRFTEANFELVRWWAPAPQDHSWFAALVVFCHDTEQRCTSLAS